MRSLAGRTLLVAWELLEFGRESVASLEDGATRIAAAQVAGLIALWTQLGTFEDGLPEVLAWSAWGLLVVSVSLLAPMVTPRRLARFWEGMLAMDILAIDSTAKEEEIVRGFPLRLDRKRGLFLRAIHSPVITGAQIYARDHAASTDAQRLP